MNAKKALLVLALVFLGFWMFRDPQGLADSSGQALMQTLTLPNQDQLFAMKKGFRHIEFNGRPTLVGVARSPGFETYATGWHSVILQTLG